MQLGSHREILAERSQGKGIRYRVESETRHLAAIVNRIRVAEVSSEVSKVRDLSVFPKNGVEFWESSQGIDRAILRDSNDFGARVDVVRQAVVHTGKRPQIGNYTLPPFERVRDEAVG
jgi:hypothetical protein